ncbi:MAG TPA: hypothetical protein VIN40_04980, partial [Candidatus Tyrphobacter sp.]
MRAFTASAFALVNAVVPLFPAFIMLAPVQPPGISLLPPQVAAGFLALVGALGLVFAVRLVLPPREAPPTLAPLLAWLGAGVFAALLGFDPRAGLVFLAIFALGIVWHLSTLRYYHEAAIARTIVWSMLVSCTLASSAAIVMTLLRWPTAQYVIAHGRAVGTFVLPGELAGYLVVLLPFAYGVAVTTKSSALRGIAASAMLAGAIAMVLTFSRTGWMGLATAIALLVAARARARRAGAL